MRWAKTSVRWVWLLKTGSLPWPTSDLAMFMFLFLFLFFFFSPRGEFTVPGAVSFAWDYTPSVISLGKIHSLQSVFSPCSRFVPTAISLRKIHSLQFVFPPVQSFCSYCYFTKKNTLPSVCSPPPPRAVVCSYSYFTKKNTLPSVCSPPPPPPPPPVQLFVRTAISLGKNTLPTVCVFPLQSFFSYCYFTKKKKKKKKKKEIHSLQCVYFPPCSRFVRTAISLGKNTLPTVCMFSPAVVFFSYCYFTKNKTKQKTTLPTVCVFSPVQPFCSYSYFTRKNTLPSVWFSRCSRFVPTAPVTALFSWGTAGEEKARNTKLMLSGRLLAETVRERGCVTSR